MRFFFSTSCVFLTEANFLFETDAEKMDRDCKNTCHPAKRSHCEDVCSRIADVYGDCLAKESNMLYHSQTKIDECKGALMGACISHGVNWTFAFKLNSCDFINPVSKPVYLLRQERPAPRHITTRWRAMSLEL